MELIECDRTYRYLFRVERLWEHRDLDWVKRFASAGLNVKDVRKVVHEDRGAMEVEFWEPTAVDRVLSVTEAKMSGGNEPLHKHFYRVNKDIIVRVTPSNFSMEPLTLAKGTEFKQVEEITGGQWVFSVQNGKYEGAHVIISPKEWLRISPNVKDLGTSFTRGRGDASTPEDPKWAPTTIDGGTGDPNKRGDTNKAAPGMVPPAKREMKKGFPPFPKRPSLNMYLTKKGKK